MSSNAKSAIQATRDKHGGLAVSCMTLVEIARLARSGRIALRPDAETVLSEIERRFVVLPITGNIALQAFELPAGYPNDPVDRIIGATALVEDISLDHCRSRDSQVRRRAHDLVKAQKIPGSTAGTLRAYSSNSSPNAARSNFSSLRTRITMPTAKITTAIGRRDPVFRRQSRGDQHPEHAGVNRISHIGIGTHGNQFVILNQPCPQCPLLSKRSDRRLRSAIPIRPRWPR